MKTNKIRKIVLIILMTFCFAIIFANSSKAAKTGFIESTPSPRKYFYTETDKLSDITLTIVGSTGMEPSDVELYEVDEKGSNAKKIEFSSSVTSNKKNHIYELSHEKLLKGKEHYFYIKIKDDKDNIHESRFNVLVKTKKVDGKEVKYYRN